MKAIVKGTVISGAGVVVLGISLALSSAGVVSGANRVVPAATPLSKSCKKNGNAWCLTVKNTGSGNAILGKAFGVGLTGLSHSSVGVYGESQSVNSAGVYGDATSSSDGVYGTSSSGTGIVGVSSSGDGVYGSSSSAYGVYGSSSSAYGVYGYSSYSTAGYFENDASATLFSVAPPTFYAQADGNGATPLFVENAASGDGFYVDADGDGDFSGTVYASGFKTDIRSRNGERLGASVALTAQATMEDTGTSRLLNGEGAVRFDSAFASTIDASRGYQVFLTPDGDTRGLYVSAKYEGGFIVRENEHGRSSVSFDYRVVAHPHGISDAYLPRLNIKPPPRPNIKPPSFPQPKPPVQPVQP